MTDPKHVCVVTGNSESGDEYGPWVFSQKPTDEQLEAFLREKAPGEFESEGPGDFGGYLQVTTTVVEVLVV